MQVMMKMLTRIDVINKALSFKGYWGNPNQFTKWYCHDNKKHAFCGMFVKYVFKKELNCDWLDTCSNFAYVPTIVSWAKKYGYWTTDYKKAKAGDLVVYNWKPKESHYSHVGIVKYVKKDSIISIEGNTTNGAKQNCVAQKTRNKKYVAGVILLPYVVKYNLTRKLKKGCKGNDVGELQCVLGGLDPDKKFGNITKSKVKAYQKSKKITVDGVVGSQTAHKLGWLYNGK